MATPLPEKFEKILAWHTDEELKLRGFTRESLRAFMQDRVEEDKKAPRAGDTAPALKLERMDAQGKRTGAYVTLDDYRDKPLGLIFGSYT